MPLKQVLFSFTIASLTVLAIASCSRGEFKSAGVSTGMLRATKDIEAGETITKESFKKSFEHFESGAQLPEVVSSEKILVELKPTRKISKGDWFYESDFDQTELETKRQEFYEKNRKRFEESKAREKQPTP